MPPKKYQNEYEFSTFSVSYHRCTLKSLTEIDRKKQASPLTHLRNSEFGTSSFPRCVGFCFGSFLFALLSCSLIFSRFSWALTFSWSWCGRRDDWLCCLSGAFNFASTFLRNIFQAAWFPWTTLWGVYIGHSGLLSGAGGHYRVSLLWSLHRSCGFSWTSLNRSSTCQSTWLSWTGLFSHLSVVSGSFLRTCNAVTTKITSSSLCRSLCRVKK